MTYERLLPEGLDYQLHRFGSSNLLYRGPMPDLSSDYCTFVGSTEVYGKFVRRPFVSLVQRHIGLPCGNFGSVNAGVDQFLKDPELLSTCSRGKFCVVTVMGANNMSNRFYTVHQRRNDRFLNASETLRTLYREVDFTPFNYTRHLLRALQTVDHVKFNLVVAELKSAWAARMAMLLQAIDCKVILLWLADHAPADPTHEQLIDLDRNPLFVDQRMMDDVSQYADNVVECVVSKSAQDAGSEGMIFNAVEAVAATRTPGPAVHREAASALLEPIRTLLRQPPLKPAEKP